MSIFDDIKHVASEAWSHGASTAESFATAGLAGPGLIYDIATSPKDIKDDLFRALGRVTGPFTDTNTFTGALAAPMLEADAYLYREGISEPISTADTVYGHVIKTGDIGSAFDTSTWSKAYEVAQHRSIGQSWLLAARQGLGRLGVADASEDPLSQQAWQGVHDAHPFVTGSLSGGVDAAASWYLDPLVVAGKGAKIGRLAKTRPISAADRLTGIKTLAETEAVKKLGITPLKVDGLKTRFDTLTGTIDQTTHTPGWLDGKDAADVYAGLRLGSQQNGRQLAGLLAETDKEANVAKRINARRQILLVAAGDTETIAGMSDELAHIDDALGNISSGAVTGVETGAVYDTVASAMADRGLGSMIPAASKAENVAEAERQLDNLPDLQNFLTDSESLYRRVLGQQDTLKAIPSTSAAGERAVGRASGSGLLRSESGAANTGHSLADDILDRTLGRPLQSLYQYSSSNMPLRVIRGLTVKTLEAGPKFTDSFRNVRPEFMLNMNDLEDVTKNVDAYARRAGLSIEQRHEYVNRLSTTTMPIERARVVEKVERDAKKSLLVKHGVSDVKPGELDQFVNELMRRYHHRRDSMVTSFQGRAFSGTKVAEDSPRMKKLQKAAMARGDADKFEWKEWTVDQLDEGGTPVHLPFLDTQDVSIMPMMPLDEVDRVLARHGGVFRAALRSWKTDRLGGDAMSDLKRAVGTAGTFGFEQGNKLWDNMVDILDMVNRAWKFTALLRLGYPIRIITDDHSRALAAHGAHVILGGIGQGLKHSVENSVRPFNNRWLATELRAERAVLSDYVGNADVLARNKAAWGEIADLSKKLKTVKSARRSGEIKARLQVLKDFHPEDLSGHEARLAEIDRMLDSKSYRVDKAQIGKVGGYEDIAGARVYLPGAFEGQGEIYRAVNSGQGSWEQTFGRTQSSIYNNFSKAGSYRTYKVSDGEQLHLEAWAEAINHSLRNSELGRIVIDGGTKEDVLKFLKTPRGREIIRKVPHQGANPEWWAHDVERMVDDYMSRPEIREIAQQREVTAADLKAHYPDPNTRPTVHGGEVDMAMGNGHKSSLLNAGLTRFYKWVGTRNDVMSRHPLFHSLYNDEVARQAESRIAVARARGVELTHEDIEAAAHTAREYARKGVNKVLFEMGGTPEIAHFMRFVSPFMAPWMEGINRWGRIVRDDPSVARRFFMVFDAPRAAGLEVDDAGNPVPKGAPISDSHYILFQMPQALGGPDPSKHQSQYKVSEASFNMVLQGGGLFNPGFGPMVQIPVNHYAVRNPEDETIQNSVKAILPFGTTSDTALGMWTPGVIDAGWTLASAKFFNHHSRQYVQMQNVLWRDKMIQFELDKGRVPNQTEKNDMFTAAGKEVGDVAGLKFLSSALSPASLQIQSKFTAQQQAFYRLQEQGRVEGKPYYWAEEQFIKQWGEAYFPLVQSSSYNQSGVSSTAGTVAALKKTQALRDRVDPSMWRMALGGEGEGAFSQTARNYLYTTPQQSGSTATYIQQDDPRRAMNDTIASQGWYDYNAVVNRLNLRAQSQGLNTYLDSAQLQVAKKKAIDHLAKVNPVWWQDYNSFSPVEYDAKLQDMRVIAADPGLNADHSRTDVKALQQYLALRDWATSVMGQRAAIGGSSSPEALSNRDVLSVFTKQVSRLVESNSWFEQYSFVPYISHDPYILDASQILPGSTGLAVAA